MYDGFAPNHDHFVNQPGSNHCLKKVLRCPAILYRSWMLPAALTNMSSSWLSMDTPSAQPT
jgi:hypothetical protein